MAIRAALVLLWALSLSANALSLNGGAAASGGGAAEVAGGKRAFIFGLGYTGIALAQRLVRDDWEVCGTCTTEEKVERLASVGIKGFLFDPQLQTGRAGGAASQGLSQEGVDALYESSHVLSTVPPLGDGTDPVIYEHGEDLSFLREEGCAEWLGYLSSTGVYGDHNGAWVDEDTIPRPTLPRTRARFAAERAWDKLGGSFSLPVHIFRLAGIYGPNRSALDTVAKYSSDLKQCVVDDTTFISRVHVQDIVDVLAASMESPDPGLLLNVADDRPATRYEVVSHAAQLSGLGLPRPQDFTLAPVSRGGGNKRVLNARMRDLLGRDLSYGDYRDGLGAIAGGDEKPFALGLPSAFAPGRAQREETGPGGEAGGAGAAERALEGALERIAALERRVEGLEARLRLAEGLEDARARDSG